MNEINNRKKLIIIFVSILLVTVLSISYAFWRSNKAQTSTNNIKSLTCLNTTLTEGSSSINLNNGFPISNEEGMDNDPYTFSIKNNCGVGVGVEISIERLTSSTLLSDYVRVNINENGDFTDHSVLLSSLTNGKALNGGVAYILKDDNLTANQSKSYDFRIWLDELTTQAQSAEKIFNGKIIVTSVAKTITSTTTAV